MTSLRVLMVIVVLSMTVVPATLATEYVVGDEKGWTLNFDYRAWAEGKEFRVGDKLIFNYPVGAHNVFRVDGAGFQQCAAPATAEALATGNDVITLATPGRKWYICGIGTHCDSGNMKLVINVLPQVESPAASPSTGGGEAPSSPLPSAAPGIALSKHHAWMIGALFIFMMVIVA